ncbi:MAG: DUF885 domain-containing protein [Lachnospiraceae bacterium]|nr:DUF885 domain-containing protein [Lachnospiraceae bacterium]
MKHIPQLSKKYILPIFLSITTIITTLSGCSRPNTFAEFTEELFIDEIASNTLNLHYTLENPKEYGITDYKISLGDYSKKSRQQNIEDLKETKLTLLSYPYLTLSPREKLTYDILNDFLDTQIKLSTYDLYDEPLSPSNGLQTQLPILFAEYEFSSEQDVTDYLKLIALTDEYFAQILDFEKEKSKVGLFMSDDLCQEVIESCESFIENPEEHYLLETFENRLSSVDGISSKKQEAYIEKNNKILTEQIIPAYEDMIIQLTNLLGTGKNDLGLCYYDNGKEYYELLVYTETGCNDTIEEIYNRINTQRMNDLIVCADLQDKDSSILEKCNGLEWELTDANDMLSLLKEQITTDFPTPPNAECSINYVDPCLEEYLAPAFYIVAPIDNYMENNIFINNANLYSDIYYFTTLAHEGYPGHLYQTVMTYEYGLEPVRSILNYSGYVEGWATYVELMSFSYANIETDVASMLSYNQSATLSLYATSDIGIHYYGWTKDDMYEFWKPFGITDTETIDEITQLILSEPGNYLKYYVGYLEFLNLKEYAQNLIGKDFSLKDFHRTILAIGPAPFYILEQYFEQYYKTS